MYSKKTLSLMKTMTLLLAKTGKINSKMNLLLEEKIWEMLWLLRRFWYNNLLNLENKSSTIILMLTREMFLTTILKISKKNLKYHKFKLLKSPKFPLFHQLYKKLLKMSDHLILRMSGSLSLRNETPKFKKIIFYFLNSLYKK